MTQFVSPFGRPQQPSTKAPSGRLDTTAPAAPDAAPPPSAPLDTAHGAITGNQAKGGVPEWEATGGIESVALPGQVEETDMVYVRRLYKEILKRDPDPEGFAAHVVALSKGTSRAQIRENFLNSPEFKGMSSEAPRSSAAPEVRPAADAAPTAPTFHQGVGPVPLEGYDPTKLHNLTHRTPKYIFGRIASHYPLSEVKDHAAAEALLTKMRPELEAAGLNVLDVKRDKIQVVTELGAEWVDVVRGAGSGNAGWWWGSEGKASPAPGAPAAPAAPPVSQAPPAPAAPTPAKPVAPSGLLSAEELAIANWAGIEPSRASYEMLMDEMGAIHHQNAIGPGVNQPKYTAELQGWLKRWGYDVDQNGIFDAKTTVAVLKLKRDEGKPFSLWRFPDGSPGVHPFIDEAMKAVIVDKYQKELGSASGHWDELGIFRPSEALRNALGQVHTWVWDQPFRDGDYSPASDQRYKETKQATGKFKLIPRFDGMLVPVPQLPRN